MSNYPIRETELAKAAGVGRSVFSKKRGEILVEGEDWSREKNAVCLTEEAALAVLSVLEVSSPALLLEELLKPKESEKSGSEKTLAVVTRLPVNTRIFEAVLDSGEKIRVRVRDSKMFALKQVVPVVPMKSGPLWDLDAPNPRKRGRIPGFNPPKKNGVTCSVTSALQNRYTTVSKSLQE